MNPYNRRFTGSRAVGVACALTATGLGILYMVAAGAPVVFLAVNALSIVLGLALFAVIPPRAVASSAVILVLGGVLLMTALFGVSVGGATRWLRFGGVSLQISLIVLPAMLVGFARRRGVPQALGMILAAVALALQPDRAMAGVTATALAVLMANRRERLVAYAFAAAVVSFGVTMARPDSLPAVPFVDQILFTSFQIHPLVGLAVVGGALLLSLPALVGLWSDSENREVHSVFGAVWLGLIAAAALGNYPTPLVGYGGSAILGYALCLASMPSRVRSPAVAIAPAKAPDRADLDRNTQLRIGLARSKWSDEHLLRTGA